jgi:hypothetical protein
MKSEAALQRYRHYNPDNTGYITPDPIGLPEAHTQCSQTMTTFSKLITSLVSDLHQGGFIKDAGELQHLANFALDQTLMADTRKDALKQIDMRCHVKWLGDFYLPHLSQKDWWRKLEKLGRSAQKLMQSI